ncbi:MAG: LPS assembly lipoprotein LptE [Kiloniellales bacterium]
MWCFEAAAGRAALIAALVALAACGFQPLYGEGPRQAAPKQIGTIAVAPIPDRLGQVTRNLLLDRLNPRGQPADPIYRLEVTLNETAQRLAFRKDATATRALLNLSAQFQLSEIGTRMVVYDGRSRATASYNVVESEYATIAAEQNARQRVARIVAEDIVIRVSVCLSRKETCFRRASAPEL